MRFFLLALFSIFSLSFLSMHASEQKTVIIMLGAPGAGKGTQAIRLSDELKLPQISTGDLFRENLKNQTEIGKKAKTYMEKGELVPDAIVLDMLFDRISKEDCKRGYILDGFPRTIPQAEALEKRMNDDAFVIALSLEVPDALILERLTGRIVCEKCGTPYHKIANPPKKEGACDRCDGKLIQRKDDTEAVVKERLRVFHDQTEPLKEFYAQRNNLVLVDGSVSKEKTITQIDASLQRFFQ